MSDLCFQASIGAYVMLGGLGVGAGAIAAAVLAVSFKEWRAALATATRRAKTAKRVECEASQSGPKGNAQNTPSRPSETNLG